MRWQQQSTACRLYLAIIYAVSLPAALYCLKLSGDFGSNWILLTIASLFVATINVRLPKISSVISMGDVFIILSLLYFGPGPALITYWLDIVSAHLSDVLRKHGSRIRGKILLHRFFFNLSCCALCVFTINIAYTFSQRIDASPPLLKVLSLACVAMTWFLVNTTTVSMAISFWMNKGFLSVWKEGVHLYLLNFIGSAAAAGLITSFHARVGSPVLFLSVPMVIVLLQLYRFYISKYEQAQKHIGDLSKLYLQTVETLAAAVDAKDRYTHGHIRRVQAYAVKLASYMGVTDETQLMGLRAGALLHDIGKIAIPEYILNKPATLTESEYDRMKLHPLIGANMLRSIDFPYPVVPVVRSHHERWDGNGYPDGLRGEHIPLGARILSLVDCYDALTTNRPYRSPMPRPEIIKFFLREAGKAYDPEVVSIFVNNLPSLEQAGQDLAVSQDDVWAVPEMLVRPTGATRRFESVQPLTTYGKAASGNLESQRSLQAVVSFARTDLRSLSRKDVLLVLGNRLSELIAFDAAAFYIADLQRGIVVAEHVEGNRGESLRSLALSLEHKLSGWAAANNQALCNLPCFPDFIQNPNLGVEFELCAVAPMNQNGSILGAISLYRRESVKFSEEEFRRLELIASQTAVAISKCGETMEEDIGLFDQTTGLPNGDQLHLMFNQVAMDAKKFDYSLAFLLIRLNPIHAAGESSSRVGNDTIVVATSHLSKQLCGTDLLVRYSEYELVAVVPRINRSEGERLRERLCKNLEQLNSSSGQNSAGIEIGLALFPQDGADLETLISLADWHARQDWGSRQESAQVGHDDAEKVREHRLRQI